MKFHRISFGLCHHQCDMWLCRKNDDTPWLSLHCAQHMGCSWCHQRWRSSQFVLPGTPLARLKFWVALGSELPGQECRLRPYHGLQVRRLPRGGPLLYCLSKTRSISESLIEACILNASTGYTRHLALHFAGLPARALQLLIWWCSMCFM